MSPRGRPEPGTTLESTASLLALARQGDVSARDRLLGRYLPVLTHWAHGRLPHRARGLIDTDDLVQLTLVKALGRLRHFEPRHEGAFLAYLRRILLNEIGQELRRVLRKPEHVEVGEHVSSSGLSPLEQVIGSEIMARYETALGRLTRDQQMAVVLRLEFGFSYARLADALNRPTPNAARLMVTRALIRLARLMHDLQ